MIHPLAFLALTAVLVLIPGPAVTLVMKYAVVAGRRSGVIVALGVLAADIVWMLASVAGVTAVLVASHLAFDALRLVGAAYLVWLGIGLLRARDVSALTGDGKAFRPRPARDGLLCDLSNPKTALVFTSIIPQFVHADSTVGPLVAGLAFAGLGFLSLVLYAFVLGGVVARLRPRGRRLVLRFSGLALIGFGGRLAAELR